MMTCKVCGGATDVAFQVTVLRKYPVKCHHCATCGFLQTDEPFWLAEAYAESITLSDTGILERNLELAEQTALILYSAFDREGMYLDYAGGYGIFTRYMRDIGFDFYWSDPYTKNLLARGFEYMGSEKKVEAVTSFETFEHFTQPLGEIENMLAVSDSIIFSTQLLPEPIPKPDSWWYYLFNHGQHVSFYARRTLEHIAQSRGMHFYSLGLIHILTRRTLNEPFLRTIVRFRNYGLLRYARKKMKSRTIGDFELLNSKR